MSRAQTPVNSQRPPLDGVHSTPQSAGSGSNLTYDTQSTRLHYSPYLYQDLSNEKIMAFEDFCKTIFDFDFDQPKKPITKKLRSLLDRYRLPVTEETSRYEPFILLANEILLECGSEYVFVRNDPKYLWGIDPGRKPDILLVHKSASLLREPIVQGPEVAFHPCDIISFHEFKLVQKDLRVPIPPRPTPSVKETFGPSAQKRKASTSEHATEGRVRKSPRPSSSSTSVARTKGSDVAAGRGLEVPVEEEASSTALVHHPLIQCASYALEMLSKGFRRHVIGFLATDGQIEFLYYDHSVVLRSSPFSFVDNLDQFHQIISHLGRMPLDRYGFCSNVILATPDCMSGRLYNMRNKDRQTIANTFEGLNLTLNNGLVLTLGHIAYQPHGLIGRGTLVVKVEAGSNVPKEWPERVVAKLSWLPSSREPEHDILKEIQKAIVRDPSAAWVSDHLPNVLYSQVCDAPDGIVASLVRHFKDDYEERRLYLLVMEELGCIDAIKDCDSLKTAYEQIVRCHHWVYERAGILHRDISVRNLMFRQKNDTIVGVLNDFDLATPGAKLDKGPTSKQRTGTWPYLAIELLAPSTWLQPPRHLYRYDLESFFWVLLTLAVDPDKSDEYNILRWSGYDHTLLYHYKKSFLSGGITTTPLQPQYKGLKEWLTSCSKMFNSVHAKLVWDSSEVLNKDTVDGLITGDTFLTLLQ
ncbi:hypothetical protein PC9H_008601 [Pleurotus ostreatus]|uniref:Protein kinase domain-containing protein n=1 Tax=Pleurotus ostreatus TaxID=5322 RepID=A0A8H6ZRY4_PLEOS|nr:uncharacterized protein PC9H_008601 [Pleurotus ostreatus]KAF7426234.1 hypothetical protein PC9H_008601 [Pleurotus ostreatus]KAJ8693700.1 hypothetical protein PTI98_008674 [Pleurotus ostreatus]